MADNTSGRKYGKRRIMPAKRTSRKAEKRATPPKPAGGGEKATVRKVAWKPADHPRGAGGRFIDT